MLWELEQAPLLLGIMGQIQRGRAIPPKIADRPEIEPGWGLFWYGYLDLANDRNAIDRIPWTVVQEWCDRNGLDETQREFFWHLVQFLDADLTAWKARKNPNGPTPIQRQNAAIRGHRGT